jgi:hypothetical protein
VTISQNPKKKKTPWYKLTNEYLLFENLRPKDCEISPRKKKKNQLPPTIINPKVIEVFEEIGY